MMNVKRATSKNPKSGVFRLKKSTWNVRNDSSHVSTLLAPDFQPDTPERATPSEDVRKPIICSKGDEKRPKAAHCDDCYCRKPIVAPRLVSKQRIPNDEKVTYRHNLCASYLDGEGSAWLGDGSAWLGDGSAMGLDLSETDLTELDKTKSLNELKNNDKSQILSKILSKSDVLKSNLDYTDKRGEYEKYSQLNGANVQTNQRTNINEDASFVPSELAEFRAKNYFDCHSIECAPICAKHKCVHKFTINERLMPEPVNCDAFGVSRCEICDKPMEKFVREAPKIKKRRQPPMPKCYDFNLAPPRLNIGTGQERIEIKVPDDVTRRCFGNIGKEVRARIRKNAPCDSLALRFQKGIV